MNAWHLDNSCQRDQIEKKLDKNFSQQNLNGEKLRLQRRNGNMLPTGQRYASAIVTKSSHPGETQVTPKWHPSAALGTHRDNLLTPKWHLSATQSTPKWQPIDTQVTPKWLPSDNQLTPMWHPNDTQWNPKWHPIDTRVTPKLHTNDEMCSLYS